MRRSAIFKFIIPGLLLSLSASISAVADRQSRQPVNINTASVEELQTLPGIGPRLAAQIIEHRQKHGPFKRPQDLIIVRGMGAKRFRQIAHLIVTASGSVNGSPPYSKSKPESRL